MSLITLLLFFIFSQITEHHLVKLILTFQACSLSHRRRLNSKTLGNNSIINVLFLKVFVTYNLHKNWQFYAKRFEIQMLLKVNAAN